MTKFIISVLQTPSSADLQAVRVFIATMNHFNVEKMAKSQRQRNTIQMTFESMFLKVSNNVQMIFKDRCSIWVAELNSMGWTFSDFHNEDETNKQTKKEQTKLDKMFSFIAVQINEGQICN